MKSKKFLFTGLVALAFGMFASADVSALPSLDAQKWRTIQVDEKIGNATDETMITVIQD